MAKIMAFNPMFLIKYSVFPWTQSAGHVAQDSISVFLIELFYKKVLCLNCVSDLEVGGGSTTVNKLETIPALMEEVGNGK